MRYHARFYRRDVYMNFHANKGNRKRIWNESRLYFHIRIMLWDLCFMIHHARFANQKRMRTLFYHAKYPKLLIVVKYFYKRLELVLTYQRSYFCSYELMSINSPCYVIFVKIKRTSICYDKWLELSVLLYFDSRLNSCCFYRIPFHI